MYSCTKFIDALPCYQIKNLPKKYNQDLIGKTGLTMDETDYEKTKNDSIINKIIFVHHC